MDDDRAREYHVNQPGPEKVERHFVGHSRRLRDPAQHPKIIPAALDRNGVSFPAAPERLHAAPRSFQKFSSPPALTSGCMETICSTRVVPDRGMPMISTGVASKLPSLDAVQLMRVCSG